MKIPLFWIRTILLFNFLTENEKDDDDEEGERDEEREGGGLGSEGGDMGCDMDMVGMCFSEFFYTAAGLSHLTSPFAFTDGICW